MNALYPDPQFVRPDPITGTPVQAATLGKETWERIFLGSMYLLGVSNPDTMARARDALLLADSILYPSDPLTVGAPGRHFALIERVFAARELGVHAAEPLGGRQTVSSSVSAYTAGQDAPAVPQNVVAEVADAETVRVSWSPVDGAIGYQVLKRRKGDPTRLFRGVPGREYFEGDAAFSSFTHLEYVLDGNQHLDHGQGFGRGPGQGLDTLAYDYVVRAIGLADNGQVGFSDLSGTAEIALERSNVTDAIDTRISNVSFDGADFELDQTLTNEGTLTVFEPLEFEILSISEPDVTVSNADNGGSGQEGDPATFVYSDSLAPGETSGARHLVFSDPGAKLFTVTARVTGQLRTEARAGTGSQDPVDVTERNDAAVLYHYTEEYSGVVPIGAAGLNVVNLVDHVDVKFTARDSALGVDATLTAEPEAAGAYPDLDFQLLDPDGRVIASSGNLGPNEKVSGALIPGETHTLRVVGFANGPTVFHIFADQIVTDPADAGEGPGGDPVDILLEDLEMQFTVNPLTGEVSGTGL